MRPVVKVLSKSKKVLPVHVPFKITLVKSLYLKVTVLCCWIAFKLQVYKEKKANFLVPEQEVKDL